MTEILAFIGGLALLLAAPTGVFYVIDKLRGRRARNIAIGVMLFLGFLLLMLLLVLISANPSADDELGKWLSVIAAGLFIAFGLAGAGIAWLIRRKWG